MGYSERESFNARGRDRGSYENFGASTSVSPAGGTGTVTSYSFVLQVSNEAGGQYGEAAGEF